MGRWMALALAFATSACVGAERTDDPSDASLDGRVAFTSDASSDGRASSDAHTVTDAAATTRPCVSTADCPAGNVCANGRCLADPCVGRLDCAAGDTCELHCVQVADRCSGITCGHDETCVNGACVPGCFDVPCAGVVCPAGQFCNRATRACAPLVPCNEHCPTGTACHLSCVAPDPCAHVNCNLNQRCVAGACMDDLCSAISCPAGQVCANGTCIPTCRCTPSCPAGHACGADDGCGGHCDDGLCAAGQRCDHGHCACVPNCPAGAACGSDDGCGGHCPGTCASHERCDSGQRCVCAPQCPAGAACGSDDGCGGQCPGACAGGARCHDNACCTPSCPAGAACGTSDGCGGRCPGPCPGTETCDPSAHTCRCVAHCPAGAACGTSDGCGGRCPGPCPGTETCDGGAHTCRCTPSCPAGAACGSDDGCGGHCPGACAAGLACDASAHTCRPRSCSDVTCACGQTCTGGSCVSLCAAGRELCGCSRCCDSSETCIGTVCVPTRVDVSFPRVISLEIPMTTMRRRITVSLLGALLATASCATDGGADGDAGASCHLAAGPLCDGRTSYTCGPDGHRTEAHACTGASATCVAGTGCRACHPASRRCAPTDARATEVCAADGSAYVTETHCATGESCVDGRCYDPCGEAAARHGYEGCEYWPVSLKNTCVGELGGDFPFAIAIANPQTTPVTVTVDGGALTASIVRTVQPGKLEVVSLPWVDDLAQLRERPGRSTVHAGGAYHVVTSAPTTVYQFNPLTFASRSNYSYSNDASLLLPTPVLADRYTLLTYPGLDFHVGNTPSWSSGGTLAVVGTSAHTHVSITLRGATLAGPTVPAATAGTTQSFDLARGDVVQLLGAGAGSDLTGTRVQADGAVAVFAGHGCAQVPLDRIAGNHLEEQAIPDQSWGQRYVVTNFADRPGAGSVVRVLAQADDTHLTFDPPTAGPANIVLTAGTVTEFTTRTDFVVSSDHPVAVAQFMTGEGEDTDEGDPAMVYAVPFEQYRDQYTFLAPETFTHNYVNIVGSTGAVPQLDGANVTVAAERIGTSELSVWRVELAAGVHTLTGNGNTYGTTVYGTALFTAYAYPGGLDLRVITPP